MVGTDISDHKLGPPSPVPWLDGNKPTRCLFSVTGLKNGDLVVLQVERDGGLMYVSFEM